MSHTGGYKPPRKQLTKPTSPNQPWDTDQQVVEITSMQRTNVLHRLQELNIALNAVVKTLADRSRTITTQQVENVLMKLYQSMELMWNNECSQSDNKETDTQ